MKDTWDNASLYESFVGRWSRLIAVDFLKWIDQRNELSWLDVGCGTGALSAAILNSNSPLKLTGVDPSESNIQFAREHFKANEQVHFLTGDAMNLPLNDHSADVVVSGLVLNFIPNVTKALQEFKRVCKTGGLVAAYLWDYRGKMEMLRYFWNAALKISDDAREKDEGIRFPICNQTLLEQLFLSDGFASIQTTFIDVPTVFKNFDDFWNPFLSGQGPAPGYCIDNA